MEPNRVGDVNTSTRFSSVNRSVPSAQTGILKKYVLK